MLSRIKPLGALALPLLALATDARAEAETCIATVYVWELQLEQVAADEGQPDLQAVARALGTQAVLRGGYRDPARAKDPVRVDMLGSTDGAGLSVLAESLP